LVKLMFFRRTANSLGRPRTAARRLVAAAAICGLLVTPNAAVFGAAWSGTEGSQSTPTQIDAAQAVGQPASPAAPASPVGSRPTRPVEVRLITGDVVRLDASGRVAGIEPGPRASAASPRFFTSQTGPWTYVFPSDVQELVGQQLDAELFNVTELASYGLGRDGTVPVIVSATRSLAAPDFAEELVELGVDITAELNAVPAGAGEADAATESGPADSWQLIEAAAETTTAVGKIWLDRVSHAAPLVGAGESTQDYQTPPWMAQIGADQARAAGLTGKGVKVAVVDSGVDAKHPDLRGRVVAEKDFTGLGSPVDEDGHGTFVASEIAGTGAASGGMFAGVAPDARIINARVLDAAGGGSNSDILAGIEWAARQGAQVINLSLGDPGMYGDGTSYFDQFINQIAKDYGCLIVVAAGNDGRLQTVASPAVADEVLSVGATSQDGNRAWFSSAGPRRGDGAVNPQIVAPGAGGEASRSDQEAGGEDPDRVDLLGMTGARAGSDGYVSDQMGTSMAAPLVAGAAALLIEANPNLDRQALRAKLVASATPAPDNQSVFEQGAGLLNIPKALAQTLTTSPTELNLGVSAFGATGTVSQTLTYVNAGATDQDLTLEAGLMFSQYLGPVVNSTDPPGPLGSGKSAGNRQGDDNAAASADDDDASSSLLSDHIELSASALTVPAGGQAKVDVTVDIEAFAGGYIGGYITATDSSGGLLSRTPVGLANEPEKHRLTITATDHDGLPIEKSDLNYDLSLVDLNRGWFMALRPSQGVTAIELAAGDYALLAYAAKYNSAGGTDELVAAIPIIDFDSDSEVRVDGTTARAVTAPTDRPVDGVIGTQVVVSVGDTEGDGVEFSTGFASRVSELGRNSVYVVETPTDDVVKAAYPTSASLAQPSIEGALDPSGSQPVPLADAIGQSASGQAAFELVSAGQKIPAGGSDNQALLVELTDPNPSEQTIGVVAEVLQEVQAAGYGAIVIGSNRPTVALAAAGLAVYLLDDIGDFRVLVTNKTGIDQLASAADEGGSLYTLGRGTPEYVYQVAKSFGPDDERQTLVTDASATAQVTVQHRAMGTNNPSEDYFWSDWMVLPVAVGAEAASSYVAHISADVAWSISSALLNADDGSPINEFITSAMSYPAGVKAIANIGSQVHGVGFDPEGGFSLARQGDVMYGTAPLFVDGQGQPEIVRNPDAAPGYGAIDLKLTDLTTGAVLLEGADDPEQGRGFWVEGLDPAAHTYRLDQVTTSDSDAWLWSTKVSSSWEWVSEATSQTDGAAAPLWQVWYELEGLDAFNAGAARQAITLHVSQLSASSTMPPSTVALEASVDNGVTWDAVELRPADQDGSAGWLYSGLIVAEPGKVVSLRSQIAGESSSFNQMTADAYLVTSSPRGFRAPVSWQSGGVTEPLPTQTDPAETATPGPSDGSEVAVAGEPGAGSLPFSGATGIVLFLVLGLVLTAGGWVLFRRSRC
jgi:subtilisin family serine protease